MHGKTLVTGRHPTRAPVTQSDLQHIFLDRRWRHRRSDTTERNEQGLWASLGGYYLLASVFVMARLRQSRRALWFVRVSSVAVLGGALMCLSPGVAHWIIGGAFLMLAARAWMYRRGAERENARTLGRSELAYSALAALLDLLVGAWLA